MSFQACIDNIHTKTGQTQEQLKAHAIEAGIFSKDMKAGDLGAWPKQEYGLGHGHSMAIWAVFKDEGWVNDPRRGK